MSVRSTIREKLSPWHVPAIICDAPEIPVTANDKKVEVVVKNIISGVNVKVGASVKNGDCLGWFRDWALAEGK